MPCKLMGFSGDRQLPKTTSNSARATSWSAYARQRLSSADLASGGAKMLMGNSSNGDDIIDIILQRRNGLAGPSK